MTPPELPITKPLRRTARRSGAQKVRPGPNKEGRHRLSKRPGKGKCEHRLSHVSRPRWNRPRTRCRNPRMVTTPGGGGAAGLVITTITDTDTNTAFIRI